MEKQIAMLPGDGIGPEVMRQAVRVLEAIGQRCQHQFSFEYALVGGAAYDQYSSHLPSETLAVCRQADAILFGSVGGPVDQQHVSKWHNCEANSILALRKQFQFNINIRPAQVYPCLQAICPLKQDRSDGGVNVIIFRELLGDLYFGQHQTVEQQGETVAYDEAVYRTSQIESIAHAAFQAAQAKDKRLVSVDKANVLDTSKLWRKVVTDVSRAYPDVELQHMLVDNCAMQMVMCPTQFSVIVTSNMFGDILSDLASVLPGSLGLMPSASLNGQGVGLFEPSGGSAPELADKDQANPIAQILSAAMMLRYAFNWQVEAQLVEQAVRQALETGYRTADIAQQGDQVVGTTAFTDQVVDYILPEKIKDAQRMI